MVREVLEAYRIPILEIEDFEADDVIATLVATAPANAQIAIVTSDKDLMQLVDDRVQILDGMKDRRLGPAEVESRFGVPPERVLDLRALVGDPSDNIPGVKGIGEKGAAQLIRDWGDLENLIEHRDEIKTTRARNALANQADEARLSKELATLRDDVPMPLTFEDLARREPDDEKLRELFERFGFTRLLESLGGPSVNGAAASAVTAAPKVEVVEDAAALDALVERLFALPLVPLVWVSDPKDGSTAGAAVAIDDEHAAFVRLRPDGEIGSGLASDEFASKLAPLLGESGAVAWIGCDVKLAQRRLAEAGCEPRLPDFDVEIAGHLLDPGGGRTLSSLAATFLGSKVPTWEDLAGRGAKAVAATALPVEALSVWAGQQACAVRSLHPILAQKLEDDGLGELFEQVELPMTRVLARMERTGVRIDLDVLAELSREYHQHLERIEREIYELAGEEFLISSPKQLQRILFEVLQLPVIKKTKTGYSTDEDTLEQLALQHDLPLRILAYRKLAKLVNTYVEALPPLVDERTGRVHPTFNQLGAATGRLSANNPNVQNIPIRTEEGVRIREAFVAADGCTLLSADYSQVELRILAHYSEDESLIESFRSGEDIHRRTAAEVAGIDPEDVTPDQRARAKAVNFGIIYGSSAFGLARQLSIASGEAQETIDAYFARYQGVRRFLDATVEEARERGWVKTLLGRRRYLPDLASRNRVLRSAAERMAVNTVIQGTAADLIKKAMVVLDDVLSAESHPARMILQVHDELVFEVPEDLAESLRETVREHMEGVLSLRVPLLVDVGVGANWREAH
jgi:DNA polymerase-1